MDPDAPSLEIHSPPPTAPPLASPLDRLLGQILDALVAGWLLASVVIVLGLAFGEQRPFTVMFVGYLVFAFYILFADGLPGGQSLGRRALRTVVIHERTGLPCSWWQSFVRNFFLVLLGPIDWIFLFGARRQRLGDMAAGTVVLKLRRPDRPGVAPGAVPPARPVRRREGEPKDWMPF